jgi:hypothetical protein
MRGLATLVGVLVVCASAVSAQWLNYPDPRIPRTADGQADLTAPPPHLADGKVDLSGIWYPNPERTDPADAKRDLQTLGEDLVIRVKTADGSPFPLLPRVQEEFDRLRQGSDFGPAVRCLPHTIVDYLSVPSPFKFVHTPGLTFLLFEHFTHFRQVFTDGRAFPTDMQPAWFGYSVGRWEEDSFIIDTAGLNDRGRITAGLMNSTSLRVTERYRRPTFGSLEVQITLDDPTQFTRPWTMQTIWFRLLPDTEFIESICENEKDAGKIEAAVAAEAK